MNSTASSNLKTSKRSSGKVYDLQSLYDRLNRLYFGGKLSLSIRWSLRAPIKAKSSVELGSYCKETQTITISRRLDNLRVPLYFVENVIFHEMLHHVFPRDPHRMHTARFNKFERMHPDHLRAKEWEKNSLHILFEAAQKQLW